MTPASLTSAGGIDAALAICSAADPLSPCAQTVPSPRKLRRASAR